jgi:hypothetical protein
VRRARMRGLQLQTAMELVAEEKLSDFEIAEKLNVRLSALKEAMLEPYFARRVAEMRPVPKGIGQIPQKAPPQSFCVDSKNVAERCETIIN